MGHLLYFFSFSPYFFGTPKDFDTLVLLMLVSIAVDTRLDSTIYRI
jgi:hypothetical protein